jgi:hypothetical protein
MSSVAFYQQEPKDFQLSSNDNLNSTKKPMNHINLTFFQRFDFKIKAALMVNIF